MLYASIIFDLDGTLLDTLEDLAAAANKVLAEFGFPTYNQAEYTSFIGDGLRSLMQRITPTDTRSSVLDACCKRFLILYDEIWREHSHPYPGIPEVLATLSKNNINLAVLSNKPHEFTHLFVNEFFPAGTFAAVYGQRQGFAKKPDPAVAMTIATQLDTEPFKILFVGDSGVDIRTGKAANMATAGVSWGFRSIKELQDNGADYIFYSPSELLDHVKLSS